MMSSAQYSSMQIGTCHAKLEIQVGFHHGVQLGHGTRLTNIRYADDLMMFATSSNDLIYMLEALIPELAASGLQLNSAKTKILTTSPPDNSEFVDVCVEKWYKLFMPKQCTNIWAAAWVAIFLWPRKILNLPIVGRLLGTNNTNANISY